MSKNRANKQKKKRSKAYTGEDAAVKSTKITRVTAPDRSKLGEWWVDHKQQVRFWGVIIGLSLVIFFLLRLVFSWIF